MDIYFFKEVKFFGKNNYIIVFFYGGVYYLSDKIEEEKYIELYFKKGLNVVNLNYCFKRGIFFVISDFLNVFNFFKEKNDIYNLNLNNIIVIGFFVGV